MRKSLLIRSAMLVASLFFLALQVFAQNRVTGTVTDPTGKGIAGATVAVKGTNNATSTDESGAFSISAPGGATLVISAVGLGTQEIPVQNRTSITVRMATQESNLNEVVVIGYGTARRRDLTGAVTTVNEKNFNRGVFTSPDQLIQGKVAGVQITNNSGQPGGQATIRIRGASALTGSGNPLFVIDGVPLDNSTARASSGDIGLGGGQTGTNPLNFINPNDIVSMDILKDASATAIYGSRAAYGVVLITTKKGQAGQPRIDFNTSVGVSSVLKKIRVLNAAEFREALTYYGQGNANDKGSNVDAFDAISRTGLVQNYNAGISGGTENARFRISLGALNQQGIINKSDIKKYTVNISGQFRFLNSRRLGLDVNILPSQQSEDVAPINERAGSRGNLIAAALRWNPTENLIIKRAGQPDSFNVQRGGDLFNPLALQEAIDDKSRLTTILASISPYFKFTDWLEYRMLYSINYGTGTRRATIQPFINIANVQDRGRAVIASNENSTQQFTHTVNINRNLTSQISLNGVIGYEYLKFNRKGFNMSAVGLDNSPNGFGYYGLDYTNYIQFSNPTNRGVGSFADPTSELQSYFARAGINVTDKYLFTATVRRDGSSKFGTNQKYGTFPSFSAAWNINREEFFPQIAALNSLKLRGGWGKTGNQEFPAGAAVLRYGFGGGNNSTPLLNNPNPNLKWQSDRQYNIGLDANLFSNRITVTADYFNKRTTDLLFPITQPAQPALGGAILWRNLEGNIDNKGFEFAINSTIVRQRDFNWDFGVNATFIKNDVSNLAFSINTGELSGQGSTGTTVQVIRNGLPLYAFVTREFLGIDKSTGIADYTENGDRVFYVGNSLPNKLVGLSTSLRYKALSLSVNANGAFGHKIYNETLSNVINVGSIGQGLNIAHSVFRDPIKESVANPVTASSRYLESGNFLKLQNATLSYALGKIGNTFNGVNFFVTGQNLFVITNYTGFDPEVNINKNVNGVPSSSIEYIPYPSARTVTFGVNFSL